MTAPIEVQAESKVTGVERSPSQETTQRRSSPPSEYGAIDRGVVMQCLCGRRCSVQLVRVRVDGFGKRCHHAGHHDSTPPNGGSSRSVSSGGVFGAWHISLMVGETTSSCQVLATVRPSRPGRIHQRSLRRVRKRLSGRLSVRKLGVVCILVDSSSGCANLSMRSLRVSAPIAD